MSNDNDNNKDNVISFPTTDRLKKVDSDRKEVTKPIFGQFGSFSYSFDPTVDITFSFENLDKVNITKETFSAYDTFPKDLGINYSNFISTNPEDRFLKFMDMCNHIQKRAAYHYSNDHQTLFNHMEGLLEKLVEISNLE